MQERAHYFVDEVAIGAGAWDSFSAELQDTLETNAPTFLDEIDEPFEVDSIDWEGLADSRVPLLVTFGTQSSHLLRASSQALTRRVTCESREIAGSGYIPHRTDPDSYAALPVDFFSPSMSVR